MKQIIPDKTDQPGLPLTPLAVIGDPIAHSLSPVLHGDIIARHQLPYTYTAHLVKAGETEQFLRYAIQEGIQGFNATMPHKIALLSLVDHVHVDAAYYGSINTVRIRDGKSYGYNTDVAGLLSSLASHGITIQGKRLLILGAGGVAGSIVRASAKEGAHRVTVLNRSLDKATELCSGREQLCFPGEMTLDNLSQEAKESDLIINCTPLGMEGVAGDFEDFSFLDGTKAAVVDLIYRPSETRLLAEAKKRGLVSVNGLGMLIRQGILAFELFTDFKLDHDAEAALLEQALKEVLHL